LFKFFNSCRYNPGGRVEYFYREVDTWHTTHPGGVEVGVGCTS
jgi:hypothetical protein